MSMPSRALLAALSGLMFFAACPDLDLWPLAWICLVPLLFAIARTSPGRAFLLGWLAGAVATGGGFHWIRVLLVRFAGASLGVAMIVMLIFVLWHSLHWGAWTYCLRRIADRHTRVPLMLAAPVSMSALEWLMPFLFDWHLGITQAGMLPVIQIADLTGPSGITFLLVAFNVTVFHALDAMLARRRIPLAPTIVGAGLLLAVLTYGLVRLRQVESDRESAPKVRVGIVQPNRGSLRMWTDDARELRHDLLIRESRNLELRGAELIVWPESAYPYGIRRDLSTDFSHDDPRRVMRGIRVPLIFGALSYGRDAPRPFNSAFLMTPEGRIAGRYDKNFLLLLGEYIPLHDRSPAFRSWWIATTRIRQHLQHGTEVTAFPLREWRIAPMICYEDILPTFGRRLAALRPHLLVNLTNDGWFGETSAPREHLALAVYRSVELRRDLVRATNTGVSAFIEATGRIRSKTAFVDAWRDRSAAPTSLLDEAALLGSTTPYAAIGDVFAWACLAATVGLAIPPPRRRPRTTQSS